MPTLCVSLITYNQRAFIGQAIDGVLMQKTDFPVSIHIGDDRSSDGTRDILRRYQDRHPDRIVLNLREQRGEGHNGRENNMETLGSCEADYVAMLDGDDYWTDDRKLQKQVDFLEASPDHTGIGHDVRYLDEGTGRFTEQTKRAAAPGLLGRRYAALDDFDLDQSQLFQFMPQASTLCFRRSALPSFPTWFRQVRAADVALAMLLAAHGPIRFTSRPMGVYRVHPQSEWQMLQRSSRREWLDWNITNYDILLAAFPAAATKRNRAQGDVLKLQRAWLDRAPAAAGAHLARALTNDPIGIARSAARFGGRTLRRVLA